MTVEHGLYLSPSVKAVLLGLRKRGSGQSQLIRTSAAGRKKKKVGIRYSNTEKAPSSGNLCAKKKYRGAQKKSVERKGKEKNN